MNPLLGVLYHWLGGLASASFYVPYRGVKRWSWEIYWLTGGVVSWLVAPWFSASLQTHDLLGVLGRAPSTAFWWPMVFGVLWGFGGLGYGLVMRYLGLSLGMAVVLGLCTVFGTLIPPAFTGEFHEKLIATTSGNIVLAGIGLTLAGIVVVAIAGAMKDALLTPEQKLAVVAEFDFRKGIVVAIGAGIMSACFAFGLAAGEPIKALSAIAGTGPLWTGLPVLCLIMAGGLVTNGVWCGWLIVKNRSAKQWLGRTTDGARPPLLRNYALSALAGVTWYFQFFFYTMGESQMGRLGFSSWTLHMASIIIFGTLWGFAFREWKDAGARIKAVVWAGVALLLIATVVIGYGNSIAVETVA
ncbi:L-rhamnose/proton symporter RhaT [Sphingomonas sp. H160509]|uniref:L-rhamnose/proton symporter RhaT n=1 Tax=Sphingomonas sp. H160509 TaxID=2955313 RepID=UPI002098531D|nr:L-rhamnose/proton symporter RhaT [Sphingomonas sp. H160509]MDD1451126.1 L-rhamnose/proton symporter RhaT [Sphingomonas sp. H160509]